MTISETTIQAIEQLIFPDFKMPEDVHKEFVKYVRNQYKHIECVVLYNASDNFVEFLKRFPELPDIKRREFIIHTGGSMSYTPDYWYVALKPLSLKN